MQSVKRRVAAGATGVLAATWLLVAAVKLSSGAFGRESRKLELAHPTQAHGPVVIAGVCGLTLLFGALCALGVLAWRIWGGSSRSERIAGVLVTLISIVTVLQAIKEKTNAAQWLGVTMDIAVLVLIALAVRASDVTTSGTEIPMRP
jgi:hypothetical protein